MSRNEMYETIVGLLGGRAAEELTQDDICTGASNDMERATSIAKAMVTKFGFSKKLGTMVYGNNNSGGEVFLGREISQSRGYSETVAFEIDTEVRAIIDKAYNHATDILTQHKDKLVLVAEYLIAHEKIDQNEFKSLMENGFVPGDETIQSELVQEDNNTKETEE